MIDPWTPQTGVSTLPYGALAASFETWSATTNGASTYTIFGSSAATYNALSAATHGFSAASIRTDHQFAAVFPRPGYDIGVNFVYAVRSPADWAVRTDRPIPITSTISDSP